jgi:hypothetical protein
MSSSSLSPSQPRGVFLLEDTHLMDDITSIISIERGGASAERFPKFWQLAASINPRRSKEPLIQGDVPPTGGLHQACKFGMVGCEAEK